MLKTAILSATLIALPALSYAEGPSLSISMADGNPHDRITMINTGSCDMVSGTLSLDFTASKGKIIIDTQYGGLGTKDPMPVEIEMGLIAVEPVSDGANHITILLGAIPPKGKAVVTLDFDNNFSPWMAARVSIEDEDLEFTTATYKGAGMELTAEFGTQGTAAIDLPKEACETDQPEEVLTPIS